MTDHRPGPLHLNAFLMSTGHHEASWRLPESDPSLHLHQHRATCSGSRRSPSAASSTRSSSPTAPRCSRTSGRRPPGTLEPTVVLTALAAVTEHIGLIATASTTYNEPYNLARRFASLDHISGGRAGWNIVTTAGVDAARNFGLDEQPAHAERYERAAEFVEVSLKLWDSWEDDARDRRQGGGRLGRLVDASTRSATSASTSRWRAR